VAQNGGPVSRGEKAKRQGRGKHGGLGWLRIDFAETRLAKNALVCQ